jgi:hypothetical protein
MTSENNNDRVLKRAYHQPEFHSYGNINHLTASTLPTGQFFDNGTGGNQKSVPNE